MTDQQQTDALTLNIYMETGWSQSWNSIFKEYKLPPIEQWDSGELLVLMQAATVYAHHAGPRQAVMEEAADIFAYLCYLLTGCSQKAKVLAANLWSDEAKRYLPLLKEFQMRCHLKSWDEWADYFSHFYVETQMQTAGLASALAQNPLAPANG